MSPLLVMLRRRRIVARPFYILAGDLSGAATLLALRRSLFCLALALRRVCQRVEALGLLALAVFLGSLARYAR
jgi:hypothetical protein